MKNKVVIIVLCAIIVALIGVVIFLLVRDNETVESNNDTDAVKFASEYDSVDEDNVFVYAEIDEIIDILENGTGIVYFGFPECPWCNQYVAYLDEVAKSEGIDTIYYYNIREDRSNNTDEYLQIVDFLSNYLSEDEDGNPRVYVPAVVFVNNGSIVAFDDETSQDVDDLTPSEYWTDEEVADLKERLARYFGYIKLCIDCDS